MSAPDTFNPWRDPAIIGRFPIRLEIAAPPCPQCKQWRPVAITLPNGDFDGVRLCHAKDMHNDFSCFDAVEVQP